MLAARFKQSRYTGAVEGPSRLASQSGAHDLSVSANSISTPEPLMRVGRVAAVTASIALVGAIIGGVIGGALMSIWSAVLPGTTDDALTVALLGVGVGAAIGAVLAPVTAWVFLRRVPL